MYLQPNYSKLHKTIKTRNLNPNLTPVMGALKPFISWEHSVFLSYKHKESERECLTYPTEYNSYSFLFFPFKMTKFVQNHSVFKTKHWQLDALVVAGNNVQAVISYYSLLQSTAVF